MGYALSKASVIRNQRQLDQLLTARTTLKYKTLNPRKLAHKLREAIAAAAEHEEFSKYVELKYLYKFKIFELGEDSYVLAVYSETKSEGSPIQKVEKGEKEGESDSEGISDSSGHSLSRRSRVKPDATKRLPDVATVLDVVGAAITFKHEEELFFPNALIDSDDEKIKILDWSLENGWNYIDHGDGGLTLTKKSVPEEVLWRPKNV